MCVCVCVGGWQRERICKGSQLWGARGLGGDKPAEAAAAAAVVVVVDDRGGASS